MGVTELVQLDLIVVFDRFLFNVLVPEGFLVCRVTELDNALLFDHLSQRGWVFSLLDLLPVDLLEQFMSLNLFQI